MMQSYLFLLLPLIGVINAKAQIAEVDDVLRREVSQSRTPSIQYVMFTHDSILYEKSMGHADVEQSAPAGSDTRYNYYSITKTFTALSIVQLVEEGKIELDSAVSSYLPDFPYPSEITVRQVLTHSAGIPNPMPLSWIHLEEEHQGFDDDAFFASIFEKHHELKAEPDDKYAYSNLGYVLLGQLIEAVTGMRYEAYVEQNILKKLQVEQDMGFRFNDHQASGYQKKNSLMNALLGLFLDKAKYMGRSTGKWKPFKRSYVNGSAYGGLMGNANGLTTYAQALLDPQSSIISEEQKRLLFTENDNKQGQPTGMCLSWFKGDLDGVEYFTHAGGGGGFYCEVRVYPKLGMGSLVLMNRSGMKDERFLDGLDRRCMANNPAIR